MSIKTIFCKECGKIIGQCSEPLNKNRDSIDCDICYECTDENKFKEEKYYDFY